MNGFTKTVSIIIPTHNRRESLWRLLEKLCVQTYPSDLIEVIVIADGCRDNTVGLLKTIRTPFPLQFNELPGKGAASARNLGASMATGDILLFIDDDIEPGNGLVEAHVKARKDEKTVVVGYLPIETYGSREFYFLHLREWWETKYFKMRSPAYRFSYEDLLSGNFSLSTSFFKEAGGFNEDLTCREDYELGARLIKKQAGFIFEPAAVGHHRDEDNNFRNSFRRKRMEGQGDWKFLQCHPELISTLRLQQFKNPDRFTRHWLFFLVFRMSFTGDMLASFTYLILKGMEYLKMRKKWFRLLIRLQNYWYLRGVADIIKSRTALRYFTDLPQSDNRFVQSVDIDLKYGIRMAELQVDALRPQSIHLYYNEQFIGGIPVRPGSEPLLGRHLSSLLMEHVWTDLLQAMVLEDAGNEIKLEQNRLRTERQTGMKQHSTLPVTDNYEPYLKPINNGI